LLRFSRCSPYSPVSSHQKSNLFKGSGDNLHLSVTCSALSSRTSGRNETKFSFDWVAIDLGFHGATAWPAEREWEFRAASSAIVDFSSTESKDNNLHPIEHTLFNVMKDQAALRRSDKSCERAAGQRFEDSITLFAAALEAASDSEEQTQIPAPNLRSQRPRRAPPSFAMGTLQEGVE
jgi:hypothetical protein